MAKRGASSPIWLVYACACAGFCWPWCILLRIAAGVLFTSPGLQLGWGTICVVRAHRTGGGLNLHMRMTLYLLRENETMAYLLLSHGALK